MTYFKLMDELFDLCISRVDENGMWYLSPHWRKLICEFKASNEVLFFDCINKENISLNEIKDIFKLEVERRNAYINKSMNLTSWIYSVISTSVEPAILQEENELMKNVIAYINEKNTNNKKETPSFIPEGMSFRKGIE